MIFEFMEVSAVFFFACALNVATDVLCIRPHPGTTGTQFRLVG